MERDSGYFSSLSWIKRSEPSREVNYEYNAKVITSHEKRSSLRESKKKVEDLIEFEQLLNKHRLDYIVVVILTPIVVLPAVLYLSFAQLLSIIPFDAASRHGSGPPIWLWNLLIFFGLVILIVHLCLVWFVETKKNEIDKAKPKKENKREKSEEQSINEENDVTSQRSKFAVIKYNCKKLYNSIFNRNNTEQSNVIVAKVVFDLKNCAVSTGDVECKCSYCKFET